MSELVVCRIIRGLLLLLLDECGIYAEIEIVLIETMNKATATQPLQSGVEFGVMSLFF